VLNEQQAGAELHPIATVTSAFEDDVFEDGTSAVRGACFDMNGLYGACDAVAVQQELQCSVCRVNQVQPAAALMVTLGAVAAVQMRRDSTAPGEA